MRYLKENEIEPYLNAGKIIEQYLGTFKLDNLPCHRFVSIGKDKDGYYCFLVEVFDEKEDGIESIYDFSSIDPDNLEGIEYGPKASLKALLSELKEKVALSNDTFLLTGFLDNVMTK
ncbi:hypothetical protein DF185_00280 [Marinifilum breve]|uniref:Uncharacterized protein n=1 Tax=Marinifilum breve TaxID=2184082 RepID=A0A2V4A117_9BACT|nr:hypothetical protein [Marinifilum breve]PXY02565.1 hypothetical protein DF185_00280 [Marinifilum breve]